MAKNRTMSRPDASGNRHVLQGGASLSIGFDSSDLESYLDALGEDAAKAIRPAAQAAAQVLYERVKLNVQALGRQTGNLDNAIYQAFSPENSKSGERAQYQVSWNHLKAPHGHLVEYGYLQRYRYYQDSKGRVRPMVRPGMDGTRRPRRGDPQSMKDAYYVTLDTPKQVPGKAFVRNASSAMDAAYLAAEETIVQMLLKKGGR